MRPSGYQDASCVAIAFVLAACGGKAIIDLDGEPSASASVPITGCVDKVAAGADHTCALLADATVYCWGANDRGQLGDGTHERRAEPAPIVGGPSTTIVGVASGGAHTCLWTVYGEVWCWGDNAHGQLGDGSLTSSAVPVKISQLPKVLLVAAGGSHTCAHTYENELWCWGLNDRGQLGNGTNETSPVPTKVDVTAAWSVVTGERHTCAYEMVVEPWIYAKFSCWGLNDRGQLGDGTTETSLVPKGIFDYPTSEFFGHVGAALGGAHSCFFSSEGLRCWGANEHGQLGDGSNSSSVIPSAVELGSESRDMALGAFHSCARDSAGATRCWGRADWGQVGDGNLVAARVTPTLTSTLAGGAVWLSAGRGHTCARQHDGNLRCWGLNTSGQLGVTGGQLCGDQERCWPAAQQVFECP